MKGKEREKEKKKLYHISQKQWLLVNIIKSCSESTSRCLSITPDSSNNPFRRSSLEYSFIHSILSAAQMSSWCCAAAAASAQTCISPSLAKTSTARHNAWYRAVVTAQWRKMRNNQDSMQCGRIIAVTV